MLISRGDSKYQKKSSKIFPKKFGGKEKVRIFAVPKRKNGVTGQKLRIWKFIENTEKTSSIVHFGMNYDRA